MSRYRTTMKDLLEKVYKEDGHQDVSSSKRMCRTIVEDAQQIESKLNSMSPEDSLDTWWTNKLAVSANNLNKARDYIVNDVKEELQEVSLKNKLKVLDRKIKKLKDKAFKKTMSTIKSPLFASEELDMTNEEIEIEEGKMKTIATMFDQGKSASEIAKALKLPVSTVKSILGEETELDEFTTNQINTLKKSYSGLKGMKIAPDKAISLSKALDKLDLLSLRQLNKEKIPFISTLARNKIYKKTGKFEELDLEESAAAAEIQRTNTRRDSMDYGMYKKAVELLRTKQYAKLGKHIYDAETAPREYVMGVLDKKEPSTFKKIFGNQSGYYSLMKPKLKEELEEQTLRQKAIEIAKKMEGNYTGAVREIEKLMKGLSKDPVVATTLKRVNEDTINEADINVDNVKKGDSEKEKELKIKLDKEKDQDSLEKQLIAAQGQINILKQKIENERNKALKPEPNRETGEVPLTVGVAYKHFKDKQKKEVKEDVSEKAMTDKEKRLQRAKDMIKYYDAQKKAALKGKNKELAKKMLKNDINEARFEVEGRVDYKGVSGGDDFSIVVDAPNEKAAEKKVEDMLFKHRDQRKIGPRGGRGVDDYEIESVERTSKSVTNKFFTYHAAENDPSIKEADLTKKQIKMVHKVADDLPKKDFKDRYGKEKGDAVRFGTATNMVKKKLGMKEDRRLYVETIAGLKKKAEKSGMPYSILKKVYDRGMAAWKGGHRPGASQQQWAFARVNSFVTKSSGTWGGADKDLAKQVRGSK